MATRLPPPYLSPISPAWRAPKNKHLLFTRDLNFNKSASTALFQPTGY